MNNGHSYSLVTSSPLTSMRSNSLTKHNVVSLLATLISSIAYCHACIGQRYTYRQLNSHVHVQLRWKLELQYYDCTYFRVIWSDSNEVPVANKLILGGHNSTIHGDFITQGEAGWQVQ